VTIAAQPSVTMNPAAASQLVFTAQPSDGIVSNQIQPPVVVTARDQFGNTATAFTGDVSIAIDNDASGLLGPATLGGTLTVAAVSGVASFGDLTIDKIGIGYTLAVSAGGVSGATSNPFTVIALPCPRSRSPPRGGMRWTRRGMTCADGSRSRPYTGAGPRPPCGPP